MNAEEFLMQETKKKFNTRTLVYSLDPIYQEVLISVMDEFAELYHDSRIGWVNVKDGLPKNNSSVLVDDSDWHCVMQVDYNHTDEAWTQTGFWLNENAGEYVTEFKNVIRWMYLPKQLK